jgi:hypothetical protein
MIIVKTDKKWKDFLYDYEVPEKIRTSEFDWLDDDVSDGFLKYKGDYFHVSQFERMPKGVDELSGWDGIMNWSYSNGIVIKLSSDGEQYKIGYYYVKG